MLRTKNWGRRPPATGDNIIRPVFDGLIKMATFQSMGSGWRLYSIIQLELHTVRYNPLRGETWIPLPKELANKKAIINVKNKDNKCFFVVCSQSMKSKGR